MTKYIIGDSYLFFSNAFCIRACIRPDRNGAMGKYYRHKGRWPADGI